MLGVAKHGLYGGHPAVMKIPLARTWATKRMTEENSNKKTGHAMTELRIMLRRCPAGLTQKCNVFGRTDGIYVECECRAAVGRYDRAVDAAAQGGEGTISFGEKPLALLM